MTKKPDIPLLPETMMAMRVHVFGGPEAITAERIAVPSPMAGQVLVAVHAAGVGPWDGWIRSGNSVLPQPLPLTLGSDVSGTVVVTGPGVTTLATGDPVYGVTNKRFTDGYAEYALCQAPMIARKPDNLDDVSAASVPVIAVTAWQMLFDHGGLKPGQSVLIHGATGNVGRYAVQLAAEAGLQVVASAGPTDSEAMRALGAHIIVDRNLATDERVDGAMDLVGGDGQSKLFDLIHPGGVLISAVAEPDQKKAAAANARATFMLVDVTTAVLDQISDRFARGKLRAFVGTTLPLSAAIDAHRMLKGEIKRQPGKIVLTLPV